MSDHMTRLREWLEQNAHRWTKAEIGLALDRTPERIHQFCADIDVRCRPSANGRVTSTQAFKDQMRANAAQCRSEIQAACPGLLHHLKGNRLRFRGKARSVVSEEPDVSRAALDWVRRPWGPRPA